jgi:hypothetical protein
MVNLGKQLEKNHELLESLAGISFKIEEEISLEEEIESDDEFH